MASPHAADDTTAQAAEPDSQTIPVFEEVATVGTRRVQTGSVHVNITVTEHDEAIEALLLRQDVAIERVPRGTPLAEPPPIRREGDTIVVPVLEERLVVEKRLFLKEELRIRIDETNQPTTQTVRLRREHAEIVERRTPNTTPDNHGDAP